jgi:precorrin-4 methylase
LFLNKEEKDGMRSCSGVSFANDKINYELRITNPTVVVFTATWLDLIAILCLLNTIVQLRITNPTVVIFTATWLDLIAILCLLNTIVQLRITNPTVVVFTATWLDCDFMFA